MMEYVKVRRGITEMTFACCPTRAVRNLHFLMNIQLISKMKSGVYVLHMDGCNGIQHCGEGPLLFGSVVG